MQHMHDTRYMFQPGSTYQLVLATDQSVTYALLMYEQVTYEWVLVSYDWNLHILVEIMPGKYYKAGQSIEAYG